MGDKLTCRIESRVLCGGARGTSRCQSRNMFSKKRAVLSIKPPDDLNSYTRVSKFFNPEFVKNTNLFSEHRVLWGGSL
jgi:hypothetical protein